MRTPRRLACLAPKCSGAAFAGAILLGLIPGLTPGAQAATIAFTATNLSDTTPGEDLWQYDYLVSDFVPNSGQGFSIFFDLSLYAFLQSPLPQLNSGWDVITVQSDPLLQSDGFLDALALQAVPSLANPFTLTFVWLGEGVPVHNQMW